MNFSDIITSARKKRSWDQATLAKKIGVAKQTVSRWETDKSIPGKQNVQKLADTLELDADRLLSLCGYEDELHKGYFSKPLLDTLPLNQIRDYESFELFCRDYLRNLYPELDYDVYRVGKKGHEQDGVDVVVDGPEGKIAYQCKRQEQFGPEGVESAVEAAADFEADQYYIFLSRKATPQARKAIEQYEKWDFMDADQISSTVANNIGIDKARRLLRRYWSNQPTLIQDFLGVSSLNFWMRPGEYFDLLEEQRISHKYQLVGREDVLDKLKQFVEIDAGELQFAILEGREGIGKTRLMKALVDEYNDEFGRLQFWVIGKEASRIEPDKDFEGIPRNQEAVFIVDDAHLREDSLTIAATIKRQFPNAKVIYTIGPQKDFQLIGDFRYKVHKISIEGGLNRQKAEQLATEALEGRFSPAVARVLADKTKDTPLFTVVGASLVNEGKIQRADLRKSEIARELILRTYRENALKRIDPNRRNHALKILKLIAAVQPLNMSNEHTVNSIKQITELSLEKVTAAMDHLLEIGILLRKARTFRVVPDLLGNAILLDAVSKASMSTGFIMRISNNIDSIDSDSRKNLFVNMNKVDWMLNEGGDLGSSTLRGLDSLWSSFNEELKQGGIIKRARMLKILKKIAYYQPERSLRAVQWLIENPTDEITLEGGDNIMSGLDTNLDYGHVLKKIPQVLKNISYNNDEEDLRHLRQTVPILCKLAQDDQHSSSYNQSNSIKVLRELLEYDPNKPLKVSEIAFDSVLSWFQQKPTKTQKLNLYQVIDVLLSTEGAQFYSEGHKIFQQPYGLSSEAVKELRELVVNQIMEDIKSNNTRRAAQAVQALGDGLQYPMGLGGRQVTDEENKQWAPIFVNEMEQLAEIVTVNNLDPVLLIAIRRALSWHLRHSSVETTKNAAEEVVNRMDKSTKYKLTAALYDGWGRLIEEDEDYQKATEKRKESFTETAELFKSNSKSTQQAVAEIEERLEVLSEAFNRDYSPHPFVYELIKSWPEISVEICKRILNNYESALVRVLPTVLRRMAETEQKETITYAKKLFGSDNSLLARKVAHAFGWLRAGREHILDGEYLLLKQFAVSDDDRIRESAAQAAMHLGQTNPGKATELLLSIDARESAEVLSQICKCFGDRGFLALDDLSSEEELDWLLRQFRTANSIKEYNTTQLLSKLCENNPEKVLEMFKERIEYLEENNNDNFRAVPYSFNARNTPISLRSSPKLEDNVLNLLRWIKAKPDSWQRSKKGSRLFRYLFGDFDEEILNVLGRWMALSELNHRTCSVILREASPDFIFKNLDFVRSFLETGEQFDNALEKAQSAVFSATISRGFSRTVGGDEFPEKRVISSIKEGLQEEPPGTALYSVLKSLLKHFESSIERHKRDDELIMDDRDWGS